MALSLQEIPSVVESRGFHESALCPSECWNGGSLETTGPRIYALVGFYQHVEFSQKDVEQNAMKSPHLNVVIKVPNVVVPKPH